MLNLLQAFVPMIPKLINAGIATYEIYAKTQKVIQENRAPDSAEWDALEAQIKDMQSVVRDTSKDI